MSAPLIHGIYIGASVLAMLLIYRLRFFDMRSLRRGRDDDADRSAFDLFDRPDLGAVVGLLVIGGTFLAMLIGWRIPAEVERVWGAGASFGLIFPDVEMTTLGRLAQVVGVVCFGLIALRLLRILVLFAAAGLAGAGGLAGIDYVLQLGWLF